MVCAAGAFAFVMPEPLQVPAVGVAYTAVRIADTHTRTNSALRTTTPPPTMGGHQRNVLRTPHCGEPDMDPPLAGTHECPHPSKLRIADNPTCSHHWSVPTNTRTRPDAALRTTTPPPRMGAHQRTCRPGSKCLVKPDNTALLLGETQSENRSLVNFCDTNPAGR